MIPIKDKVSIVTVVLNDVVHIENTIKSVLCQTYSDIEYILIDGNSYDGTLDIVKKYEDRISICISEKDSGVYDAMNKAINFVSGEWVLFLNSGDTFVNNNVVQNVFGNHLNDQTFVVFGDTYYVYEWGTIIARAKTPLDFSKGLPFNHQSVFVRSSLLKNRPFNIKYSLAADFDFFYNLYIDNVHFEYVPIMISNYLYGGLSSASILNLYKEIMNIQRRDCGWCFMLGCFKAFVRDLIINNIPANMINRYRLRKYSKSLVGRNS